MPLFILACGIFLLFFLIVKVKLNSFLSLVLVAMVVGYAEGLPIIKILPTIQSGLGATLGGFFGRGLGNLGGLAAVLRGLGLGQLLHGAPHGETSLDRRWRRFLARSQSSQGASFAPAAFLVQVARQWSSDCSSNRMSSLFRESWMLSVAEADGLVMRVFYADRGLAAGETEMGRNPSYFWNS